MFYRLVLGLGLLVLPLASAEAAYQQNYILPNNDDTSSSSSSRASTVDNTQDKTDAANPLISPWVEVEDTRVGMTRAAFTAELVRALYTEDQIDHCFSTIAPKLPATFTLIFTDVTITDDYAKEMCVAMRDGIIRGFGDGSFAPNKTISFAESSKILSRAFALAPYADADTQTIWYGQHVRGLLVRNAVPVSITKLSQKVTVAEMREMLDRLQHGITWRTAQTESVIFPVTRTTVLPSASQAPTGTSSSSSTSSETVVKPVSSTKSAATSSTISSETSAPVSSKSSFWDLF